MILNRYGINESVSDYTGNTAAILKIGTIPMYIPKLDKVMDVELKSIVQCVDRAIAKIITRYRFMAEYIRYNRTMYVLADPTSKNCIHKTMSVDTNGNLWMNVHFIYKDLNNDTNRVFGIIFHELMHNFLNHLERGMMLLPMENRKRLYDISPALLADEDMKQNLCADLEVNLNMVVDGVVDKNFWIEMHGMYDEKYLGKTFEEIYKTSGDKLLSDYKLLAGSKMDEEYYEALKAIVKALKVLHDPYSTERDKEKAATELEDIINRLFGERKDKRRKESIRDALRKIQKTRIKEYGEIGPLLKKVVDDLAVSPKNMEESEVSGFYADVDELVKEMVSLVDELAKAFRADAYTLETDIPDCFNTLKEGVGKLTNPELTNDEVEEIENEIILKIKKLLADDLKKKELDDEAKKKKEELEKKKEEKAKKELEESKSRHLLHKYNKSFENLSIIYHHDRASEKTFEGCESMMDIIKPLLTKEIVDITASDVKGFDVIIGSLKDSLKSDLQKLVDEKVLLGDKASDKYINRLVDEFYQFNIELFNELSAVKKLTDTELVTIIQNAIDSIRLIGKNLHTRARFRPSDEYKEAYKKEYKRLSTIYKELGEKGLRRELGLPPR